jgi:hypothetical protein
VVLIPRLDLMPRLMNDDVYMYIFHFPAFFRGTVRYFPAFFRGTVRYSSAVYFSVSNRLALLKFIWIWSYVL